MELNEASFLPFVHALFFFILPFFSLAFFRVLESCLVWSSGFEVFLREISISLWEMLPSCLFGELKITYLRKALRSGLGCRHQPHHNSQLVHWICPRLISEWLPNHMDYFPEFDHTLHAWKAVFAWPPSILCFPFPTEYVSCPLKLFTLHHVSSMPIFKPTSFSKFSHTHFFHLSYPLQ